MVKPEVYSFPGGVELIHWLWSRLVFPWVRPRVDLGGLVRWLAHVLGIDTQQSYFYDFWSGVATQGSMVIASVTYYRKHNCHRAWCPRVGKHVHEGTPWCSRHHPLGAGEPCD